MTPTGTKKIWLRRAVGILVLLVAIAVAGLAGISQTAAFRDWFRRRVVALAHARTTGRVAIGSIAGNLFGRLAATDVRVVFEGQRVLAIRRLEATYDVLPLLLGGDLRIRTLSVDGLAMQVIADERGWNVERMTTESAEHDGDLAVNLESVRITNGALRVVRPERAWRLRGLTLTGTAGLVPGATRFAIHTLAFTEQGSGIRLEDGAGRFAVEPTSGVTVEGVRLRTPGSALDFDGRVGPPGARRVEAHLRVPRLAATEVKALFGTRAPPGDWRGELHASGPDSAVMVTGDLRAEIASDGAPREVGRARLGGTLDARTGTPVGELHFALEHVDVGVMGGPRLPTTDLTGDLRLTTTADAPRTVRFALDLRDPRVGVVSLATLALTGTADAESVRFDASAGASSGAARVTGTVVPKSQRFDLRATANELDPGLLTGHAELSGRVSATMTLTGEGFLPATTRADLALAVTPSRIGTVTVSSGMLTARAEAGRLVVERASIATSAGTAEAAGSLALGPEYAPGAGELRGELRITDLRPLAALVGRPGPSGAASVSVVAQGGPEARAVQVHGRGRDVVIGTRKFTGLDLDGWWQGNVTAGRAGIDLRGREGALLHQLSAELTLGGTENRVTITKLRFDQHGQSWVATGTPVLVQRGDRVSIDDLAVRSARGSARVRGFVDRVGENDLELVIDALELEALTGLLSDDVGGRLVGRAHLGGTLAVPRVDADVAVEAPLLGGVRYDELRARLVAGAGQVELHGRLAQGQAQALVVDGSAPVQFSLMPWRFDVTDALEARLRADDIDVAFLASLWPGLFTRVGGRITGDVTLSGSWTAPEAHGAVALASGRGYLVPLGVDYDPVEIELRLEGRAVSIARCTIQSGSGRLLGGGNARLGVDGAVMDARFEAQRFPLFANQYGRGLASGWLWISGPLTAPVLEGSLATDGLVLQIPEVLPSAVRQPDPTIIVIGPAAPAPQASPSAARPPPAVPRLFDRVAVMVQLAVPRDAWVRRSDANVEFQGWMTAWKKPGEAFHLAGDIRGVRGWYAFQGKKFSLTEGSVRFGGEGLDPALDITATHRSGQYLVRLHVGGTITKPSLALESEPTLDQADVLAVLLFGSPASGLSRSQSAGLREQALGIAGGYVASELRQSVADALGVDDLQFDTGDTGIEGARVSIGKYVADDIFVSLAHRFGAQSVEEVRIEWVIRPEWSLETSTDTLGRSGVDLFWKRRY